MKLEIYLGSLPQDDLDSVIRDATDMHKDRLMMRGKRDEGPDSDDEDSYEQSESDKLADLHAESRGKPAPIPVTESDFHHGDIRRSLKKRKIPMPKQKKGR
jgi:hypothetical protein